MLERMSPEQFDEWQADYNLEPWGNEEFNFARQASILHNGFIEVICALLGINPDESLYRTEADFLPGAKGRKPKDNRLTVQEAEVIDRMRYGRK